MSEKFEPRNDLENHLLALHSEKISSEEFVKQLMISQIFMPVHDEEDIKGFQRSTRAKPLSLEAEGGIQVLLVFTSPERAKDFIVDFPGYEGGLLTEFTWILDKMGSGYGIALNPGWDIGFDLEPEMVLQLAQSHAQKNKN